MSTHVTDDMNEATNDEKSRYAELNVGNGEFVIYDRENHQSWIQSSMIFEVGSMR